MKLTSNQQNIIDLMNNGYELGYDSYRDAAWLQLGGCGFGGTSINVTKTVFKPLLKKGLVSPNKESYPTTTYKLVNQ